MKTQITVFENLISGIDNDCRLCTSQKYTPQWHINSRCAACKRHPYLQV